MSRSRRYTPEGQPPVHGRPRETCGAGARTRPGRLVMAPRPTGHAPQEFSWAVGPRCVRFRLARVSPVPSRQEAPPIAGETTPMANLEMDANPSGQSQVQSRTPAPWRSIRLPWVPITPVASTAPVARAAGEATFPASSVMAPGHRGQPQSKCPFPKEHFSPSLQRATATPARSPAPGACGAGEAIHLDNSAMEAP